MRSHAYWMKKMTEEGKCKVDKSNDKSICSVITAFHNCCMKKKFK